MAPQKLIIHECAGVSGAPSAIEFDSFSEFADALKTPEVQTDKRNALTLLPVSLVANPSQSQKTGGIEKSLENVATVNALALDFDGVTEDEILKVVKDDLEGLRWVAHTTFSHPEELRTTGKQRWRVWVELSEPVPAALWVHFREIFDANISVVVDRPGEQNTKNPNRLMFAPCVAPGEEGQFEALDWRDFPQLQSADPLDVRALQAMPAPALSTTEAASTWVDPADEPIDLEDIRALAVRYNRRAGEWDKKVSRWLKRILKGDAFVTEHSHEPTMDLARVLADDLSHVRAEALSDMVAPSLAVMRSLHGSDETAEGFTEKIKSWRKKRAAEKKRTSDIAIPGMTNGAQPSPRGSPVSFQEGDAQTARSDVPLKDPTAPWIVQKGDTYFFRQADGFYSRQYSGNEAETQVDEMLVGTPVETWSYTEKGDRKNRKFKEITRDAAVVANDVVFRPGPNNYWDGDTRQMIMACCALNPNLKATYHEGVEKWVKAIFGNDAEAALDWFAIYPKLEYNSRALLMVGPKGVGKTLIIKALARVYGRAAGTDLDNVQGWNQSLLKCPLVFSDERTKVGLADLRKLVAGVEPIINRKFMESAEAQIRPRVVLGANDLEIFSSDNGMTAESLAATRERFLAIRVVKHQELLPEEAEERVLWQEKTLPEYIMWLAENRSVKFDAGARFCGRAGGFDITIAVAVNSNSSAVLCAIAAQFLAERQRLSKFVPNDQTFVKDGVLHFTYEFVRGKWEARSGDKPKHRELRSALHAVALDGESVARGRDDRKRYWRIDPAKLARFVADTGDYGEEDVHEWLARDDEAKVLPMKGA